jgi:DNA (cytosine-5)-methyltransferase 1
MKFLSVCSGIEAASVAWNPIGWEAVGFSEIDPFASGLLKYRFPHVTNYGDMRDYAYWKCEPFDLLCGGTPCQAFSVAGLRAGLADTRGNLALVFLGCINRFRPRWIVWENVPGVLSSISHDAPDTSDFAAGKGRFFNETMCYTAEEIHAFNAFLAGLSELGYGWAYRILDAQYFGVPQRRRRIFVVGYLGDWRRAAAVLFEPESLRRDSKARGKTTESASATVGTGLEGEFDFGGVSGTLTAGAARRRGSGIGPECIVPSVTSKWAKGSGGPAGDECQNIVVSAVTCDPYSDRASEESKLLPLAFDCKASGRNGFGVGDVSPTLRGMGHRDSHQNGGGQVAIAFSGRSRGDDGRGYDRPPQVTGDRTGTLDTVKPWNVGGAFGVRRLTPRECERLQGFPDDWTLITYRGKPAADGPRYKAIGNSWAVPVARWIGERISFVNDLLTHETQTNHQLAGRQKPLG